MKRMSKILCLLLSAFMLIGLLTACSDDEIALAEQAVTAIAEMAGEDESEAPVEAEEAAVPEEEAEESTPAEEETVTAEDESDPVGEEASGEETQEQAENVDYYFRSEKLLNQHYEKHGIEMGFASAEEYEAAASAVINNPDALSKTEAEDGDQVYYVEATNEFVILSTDGYIRTYFYPSAGLDYYNRQ